MAGWVMALRVTGLGWYVVVCILGGAFAGIRLDKWLDSYPIITVVGLLLGVIVASFGVYRMVAPILAQSRLTKETMKQDKEN